MSCLNCFSGQTSDERVRMADSTESEGKAAVEATVTQPSLVEYLQEASWSIISPRIFDLLAPARKVLVAGCGGGYDILSGLPLYFALRRQGKSVYLANFSFTDLPGKTSSTFCEMCVRVTDDMQVKPSANSYFPEYYLCQWFRERFGESVPVYAFFREAGVKQLSKAYTKICLEHDINAIVLVDGGTDSLMFGYEESMGTPVEDQTSITAVYSVQEVQTKLLTCIGFGVDSFHGVSHGLFLENVATLEKAGGYYGCFSIPQHSVEGQLYMEGYQAVAKCMQPSIVSASITDAMQGHFGNHHSTQRTGRSQLFINPLMPIFWTFDLARLVEQIPYSEKLLGTGSAFDVMRVIAQHQELATEEGKIRKPISLPM